MALTRPSFNQINSTVTSLNDPLTVVNKTATSASQDIGFIFNRDGGATANVAIVWDETNDQFVLVNTSSSGATNANVTISSYANAQVNQLQADLVKNREQRYTTSNMMKFNQLYTGAAAGSYFTQNEYQKIVTIIPASDSENYQVSGRILCQNAGSIQTINFKAALRSGDPLPDLSWSITYDQEHNGTAHFKPQLWTKETTTAGFIFAIQKISSGSLYGTVTVDLDIIPRSSGLLDNVTVNTTQNSEQTSIDAGYTANDMTLVKTVDSTDVTLEGEVNIDAGNLKLGGTAINSTATELNLLDGVTGTLVTTAGSQTLTNKTLTSPNINEAVALTATATELNLLDGVTGLTLGDANEILIVGTGGTAMTSTSVLSIDDNNNYIGINQTSPAVTLHMTGEASQSAQIRMEQMADTADAPDIRTRKSRGTAAAPTKNNAGDFIYRQNHERYNGTSWTTVGQVAVDTDDTNADRFVMTFAVSEDGTSIDAANNQLQIDGNDSGAITFNQAYKFPTSDGSANQVLQTDGSGALTFVDQSGGGGGLSDIVEDTTPQLGGDLDLNSSDITGTGDINITGTGTFTGNVTAGNLVTSGTVTLDRLALTSSQTTVSPLQLTASSLNDGVGALRIDGAQADIFLNPSTATHTTVTFAVNDDQRLAFGMDNSSDFYITRRTGGAWYDDTLVIDRDTGDVALGYTLTVTGDATFGGDILNGQSDGVGNIGNSSVGFNTVHAIATSAQYADLAEKYTTDHDYEAGTVVVFGGNSEITQSTISHDRKVAGVISTNPAVKMNDGLDGQYLALQGRVPCKVIGPIEKGDLVVTSHVPGLGVKLDDTQYQPGCVIGKALESIEDQQEQVIEVVVGRL